VVDLLGFGPDAPFPGRSLARFWDRADPGVIAAKEPLLMETGKPLLFTNQGREPAANGPMKSLVAGGMHYIRGGDGVEELYALGSDPQEQFNLAGSPNAQLTLQRFRAALASMLQPNLGYNSVVGADAFVGGTLHSLVSKPPPERGHRATRQSASANLSARQPL
jgi:hypothetical protein